MSHNVEIKKIEALGSPELSQLTELLVAVVDEGASIGFMAPLDLKEAEDYWKEVLQPGVKLWVALINDTIIGTVQLQLAMKKNGSHRAEVAKLMVHPDARKNGAARKLMKTLESAAKDMERNLLVLDTRSGDPSNLLYLSLGYMKAGEIPHYARSSNGKLHATVFYYKEL